MQAARRGSELIRYTVAVYCRQPLEFRDADISVVDLHQIDVRRALATFLPARTILFELNRSIEAENVYLPKCGTNGFRLGLAGDLDGFRYCADTVITAEARG